MAGKAKRTVVLVRGPSGSGKTTYAEGLRRRAERDGEAFARMSADDFFEKDGRYAYDPARRLEAHQVCLGRFIEALARMGEGRPAVVVVDNTFCERWEMENYVRLARLLGWGLRVVEMAVETADDEALCAGRNTHGVPYETVAGYARRFEPWPGAERVRVSEGGRA